MSDARTGRCLCGSVSFRATDVPDTFGICHCDMCRRWTGSAFLEVSIPEGNVTWQGTENIARRATSDWAERAWCRDCGSPLYYRVTMAGEWAGNLDIALGLFDEPGGFRLSHEIFIDSKPDSFAFAGAGHRQLTRQDCIEKFGLLDDSTP